VRRDVVQSEETAVGAELLVNAPSGRRHLGIVPPDVAAAVLDLAAKHLASSPLPADSYVEMLVDPRAATQEGQREGRAVVLRFPSRFSGLEATCTERA
jgi:hypothetical protein